jgi:hypothetical protein
MDFSGENIMLPEILTLNLPDDVILGLFSSHATKHFDTASQTFLLEMQDKSGDELYKKAGEMLLNAIIVNVMVEGIREFENGKKTPQGETEKKEEDGLLGRPSERPSQDRSSY